MDKANAYKHVLREAREMERQQQIANDLIFAEFMDKKQQDLIVALVLKLPMFQPLPRVNFISLWLKCIITQSSPPILTAVYPTPRMHGRSGSINQCCDLGIMQYSYVGM